MSERKSFRDMIPDNTREIEVSGGTFTVRGLSPNDVGILCSKYMDTMSDLYAKVTGDGVEEPTKEAVEEQIGSYEDLAQTLIRDCPRLLAEVIVLASDMPDDPAEVEAAMKLPFPAQIEALHAIGELTFIGEGSVKKTLASILQMVRAGRMTIGQLQI